MYQEFSSLEILPSYLGSFNSVLVVKQVDQIHCRRREVTTSATAGANQRRVDRCWVPLVVLLGCQAEGKLSRHFSLNCIGTCSMALWYDKMMIAVLRHNVD